MSRGASTVYVDTVLFKFSRRICMEANDLSNLPNQGAEV